MGCAANIWGMTSLPWNLWTDHPTLDSKAGPVLSGAGSSPDFHQGTFSASLQVVAFAASLASFLLPRIATLGCVAVVVYILGSLKCSLGVLLLSAPRKKPGWAEKRD